MLNSRTIIHETFVARFHVGPPPTPCSEADLDALEAKLKAKLPLSFRQFLTRFGPTFSPWISDAIADLGLGQTDVELILGCEEIADVTESWSVDLYNGLIAVAADSEYHDIGFRCTTERFDDAPVLFLANDPMEVIEIAPSFDSFLTWFIERLPTT